MFWNKKPAPRPDRLATFMSLTHEAVSNATANASFSDKARVAEALERFAESVRLSIAMSRPI